MSTPADLWHAANKAHPSDPNARRSLYKQLMIDHGFIISKEKGEPESDDSRPSDRS